MQFSWSILSENFSMFEALKRGAVYDYDSKSALAVKIFLCKI